MRRTTMSKRKSKPSGKTKTKTKRTTRPLAGIKLRKRRTVTSRTGAVLKAIEASRLVAKVEVVPGQTPSKVMEIFGDVEDKWLAFFDSDDDGDGGGGGGSSGRVVCMLVTETYLARDRH
jgi:hypothetical protein